MNITPTLEILPLENPVRIPFHPSDVKVIGETENSLESTPSNKRKHVILGTVIKVGKQIVGQVICNEYVKD